MPTIQRGLAVVEAGKGRFKPHTLSMGALLIDDTYNASASSVESATATLGAFNGKKIFVMSNMGELGEHAPFYHREMGRWAKKYGVDQLWLFGDRKLLQATCEQFPQAQYFNDKQQLVEKLRGHLDEKTMVIVKGSRANKMEEVVVSLIK